MRNSSFYDTHFKTHCLLQKGATLEISHHSGNAQHLMEETYTGAKVPHLCSSYPTHGRLRSAKKAKSPGVARVGARQTTLLSTPGNPQP